MRLWLVTALIVGSLSLVTSQTPSSLQPYTVLPRGLLGKPWSPNSAWRNVTNPLVRPNATVWPKAAKPPFPTSSWWSPLMFGGQTNALPYLVNAPLTGGLQVCIPQLSLSATTTAYKSKWDNVVGLTAVEPLEFRQLVRYDDLSVSFRWPGGHGVRGSLHTTLLQGMAFATVGYAGLTPALTIGSSMQLVNLFESQELTGARFELIFNNSQVWLLYASMPLTLRISVGQGTLAATTLRGTAPFHGVLRLAAAPTTALAALYDSFYASCPTRGTVSLGYTEESDGSPTDTGFVRYDFKPMAMGPGHSWTRGIAAQAKPTALWPRRARRCSLPRQAPFASPFPPATSLPPVAAPPDSAAPPAPLPPPLPPLLLWALPHQVDLLLQPSSRTPAAVLPASAAAIAGISLSIAIPATSANSAATAATAAAAAHAATATLAASEVMVLTGAPWLTIRGPMVPVLSRGSWLLGYPLSDIEWDAPSGITDAGKWLAVAAAVVEDRTYAPKDTDTYFGSSQLAALGRLIVIADELAVSNTSWTASRAAAPVRTTPTTAAAVSNVSAVDVAAARAQLAATLEASLTAWLNGTNPNPLLYDTTWGGIVSTNGLQGLDFGMVRAQAGICHPGFWVLFARPYAHHQAKYNDHHYHYGYLTYAAAAMARSDAAWASRWGLAVLDLVRDFANPAAPGEDPWFPSARHFDWFSGHSWAGGADGASPVLASGRNQESTSEAVNSYYSVALLGSALRRRSLAFYGRLLTAMEIRSAQTYWHIPDLRNPTYPPAFARHGVVGILWSVEVQYSTWFGDNPEFIHGVQMLPFTPISEALLPAAWARVSYSITAPALIRASPPIAEGFRAYLIMARGVFDPEAAWEAAERLTVFDGPWGTHRKGQILYWLATRPRSAPSLAKP